MIGGLGVGGEDTRQHRMAKNGPSDVNTASWRLGSGQLAVGPRRTFIKQ